MRREDMLTRNEIAATILVPLIVITFYVVLPKSHVIEGEVIRADCYQGFASKPSVVIQTSVGKSAFYSSRKDCLLLSTEIGNEVRLLVYGDTIHEVLA